MLKKTLVLFLSVAVLLLAAGCPRAADPVPPANGEELPAALEIVNWWTAGGEAEALAALFGVFGEHYPDYSVINSTIAGGAGIGARAVLIARMVGGRPPDTFQVHAGQGVIDPYVIPGLMEPITFIYEEEGWLEVFPEALLDMLRYDDEFWTVPVNIHRSNALWYNRAVFIEHNLTVPATLDEFFTVAETLSNAGVIPLALGETWTVAHLFESVLLGTLGPDAYIGLWNGTTAWDGPEVTSAIANFNRMLDYVNEDFSALSWDEAARLVVDGEAAMYVMGDWAHGYFMAQEWTPGVEYGWAPSPGTAGSFMALSDSFGLPLGAPNRDVAVAWLRTVGSPAGQDAFNPIKGSIPARTDADRTLYDVYLISAMDDFARDAIVPSFMHGAAAAPAWMDGIIEAVAVFAGDRNEQAFQSSLVAAAEDALAN
ncbi:MAG TPA: ABC transporter substrate-binding protein [Candidatus Limnocylindrales bacterium]|nr:ABC transporter substrate-binding protein [Candidatus Limnocylindrales bacterium]